METKENENKAEEKKKEPKKELKYSGEGLLNRAGNASLDPDLEIIFEDIKHHWIYEIKEKIPIHTANDLFYAKKVDNHIEVGIAKVDFIK